MVNIGVDLHKTQFTICVRRRGGDKFEKYPTTEGGYKSFLKKAAIWQKKGEAVRVGVESTGNTRYFKSRMEDAGIGVVVVNTLKFKVVNESVNKTDKHDASTIVEFLEKDMLPQSKLCSRESEQLRRLLKVRTTLVRAKVVVKNQIHALFTSEGLEDVKSAFLQSKRGRQLILDALKQCKNGLVAQPLIATINRLDEDVKAIEDQLEELTTGDRMVELLMTIPGCGKINAWTIRAYTDDIKRFSSAKKYASFAGLAPWVQNTNETIHHGRITKRGPKELRTAMVQIVMGIRRMKEYTRVWRIMKQYEKMKKVKGSGRSIIATARKMATIIWHMLTSDVAFDHEEMIDPNIAKELEKICSKAGIEKRAMLGKQKTPVPEIGIKKVKIAGVAREKIREVG